jgi:cell wall-associated NlpC family hydrolase
LFKWRKDNLQTRRHSLFAADLAQDWRETWSDMGKVQQMRQLISVISASVLLSSCIFVWRDKDQKKQDSTQLVSTDTLRAKADSAKKDSVVLVVDTLAVLLPAAQVRTKDVKPQQVVEFAKTLIGTPYRYASTDPKVGFDCSGFITYVFNHFKILVPRSSIDFTNVGKTITPENAKPGDLILFTGTDSTEKFVGHMGLVVSNENNQIEFIHSTSGKKHGVTITPFTDYYHSRFMKTIRIFPQNDVRS